MIRTFNILTKIDASEEMWANIDDAVARIMACDVKHQIEDICLSTLDVVDGKLADNFALIVVGRLDEVVDEAIHELTLNIPYLMVELVCPATATLSCRLN